MLQASKILLSLLVIFVAFTFAAEEKVESRSLAPNARTDLDTSATSAKLFNLGSLLGSNPYGNGYYTGYRPPNYYPNSGVGTGYYPNTGSGYYPNTGSGYYPSTGGWSGNNYPNYGSGYYPQQTGGSYYPTSGYYPNTGYYPGGTNILGNGGYGGYGGNGGLRQYYGYLNPDYTGYRNRGYGYFAETDRYGLPNRDRGFLDTSNYSSRERDRVPGAYRGYD